MINDFILEHASLFYLGHTGCNVKVTSQYVTLISSHMWKDAKNTSKQGDMRDTNLKYQPTLLYGTETCVLSGGPLRRQ
jgi:hypothetical protein